MRVLLDANVIVATFATKGTCHEVYQACLDRHTLLTSATILDEARRILISKIKGLPGDVGDHLGMLQIRAVSVTPSVVSLSACRDAGDLHVLGAAAAGRADLIITGDDDLLELREFRGMRIIRPGDALRLLIEPPRSGGASGGGVAAERRARYRRRRRR